MNEPSEEQLITWDEVVHELNKEVAEAIRRKTQAALNEDALPREELELRHGQVWNTAELARDYVVEGFGAPLVVVKRKSDQTVGTLYFQHQPRLYWGFKEHRV